MLTEEEAKTKWCPFARAGVVAKERMETPNVPESAHARCIGSACMAWRSGGEEPEAARKADDEYKHTGKRLIVPVVGYCCLAGVPA